MRAAIAFSLTLLSGCAIGGSATSNETPPTYIIRYFKLRGSMRP